MDEVKRDAPGWILDQQEHHLAWPIQSLASDEGTKQEDSSGCYNQMMDAVGKIQQFLFSFNYTYSHSIAFILKKDKVHIS